MPRMLNAYQINEQENQRKIDEENIDKARKRFVKDFKKASIEEQAEMIFNMLLTKASKYHRHSYTRY